MIFVFHEMCTVASTTKPPHCETEISLGQATLVLVVTTAINRLFGFTHVSDD